LCPRGRRLAGLLMSILGSLACAIGTAGEHRQPYVPASPFIVLANVPSMTDPRVRGFDQLRSQLNRDPHNLSLAVQLADAYINYGRSTGDARYVGRGMAVVEPWLQGKPTPIPALLVRATVLQYRHLFRASRGQLDMLLARDSRNLQAWLTLSSVEMVQADYAAANDACVQVAQIGGNFVGMLCTAQLRSLTGHAEQAYALLKQIEYPGPVAPPAIKGYVEGLLATTAERLGKTSAARHHFEAALQWTPGDDFTLAQYSDFLLERNQPAAVEALLVDHTASDTSFLRVVFAESELHDPRAPQDIAEMRARFTAMNQRGSHIYQRENTEFVLRIEHEPGRALQLAEENWTVQREPEDMRIYLEAALAAGQPRAAQPVLTLLAHSHLQDPKIDDLRTEVEAALGRSHELATRNGFSR
ncbi:MAG: tetratricopeptide repeat protein, partial [Acetobacteraceae bacterium]